MYWYDSPKRIWQYNPQMKFIIILRNPIERAFSHWNMETGRGAESLSFSEAIRTEVERCRAALPLQHRVFSYIDRGFYTEQLRRIWHYFPREQTLVIKNEELRNDLQQTLGKISSFLGVSEFEGVAHKDVHSRPYKSSMNADDHAYLTRIFYDEIKTLEGALGWDCSDWLPADSTSKGLLKKLVARIY